MKHAVFSSCSPLTVNPAFFLAACIRDLCQDQSSVHRDDVKCSVITALAHACASKGILVDWMKNETLASSCRNVNYGQCSQASGSDYSECVSECRSSCTDIDVMPSSCIAQCVPGTIDCSDLRDAHPHPLQAAGADLASTSMNTLLFAELVWNVPALNLVRSSTFIHRNPF